MCQIHLVKSLGNTKIKEKDLNDFYSLMCYGSFHNRDAFGFFNEKCFLKKNGIFNGAVVDKKNLLNKEFIVGHNRLSSGMCYHYLNESRNEDNHPFKLNDFVLVHNGIIINADNLQKKYNLKTEINTDSYAILQLIDKFFRLSNGTRRDKVVKAIKKTTPLLSGSYSIFLYDTKSKDLFYFKSNFTEFNVRIYKDKLIGSTKNENLKLIKFGEKFKRFRIQSEIIYLFNSNKTNPIKEIGSFKEKGWVNSILGDIFSMDYSKKIKELDNFFKRNFGFIPRHEITLFDTLIIYKEPRITTKKIETLCCEFKEKRNKYKIKATDLYELKGGNN